MPKTKLDPDEYALYLGQITVVENFTAVVKKDTTDPDKYLLDIQILFKPDAEYVSGTSNDLPPDASFAVHALGGHRDGGYLITYTAEEQASDAITFNLKFKTKGIKGNHGA